MDVDIRTASAVDVGLLQEWALREGWGAGIGDIAAFHRADPEGFLLAWDDERPVGSISAVRYDDSYSFVGYFIVDPALRGRGIGHRLFDAALDLIGTAASGLDGVEEQVSTYASLGYVPSHVTTRYAGSAAILSAALAEWAMVAQEAVSGDVDGIIEYDAQHVPARRDSFVRAWLAPASLLPAAPPTARAESPRTSYVVGHGHDLRGYATVRPMIGGGSRIGPVFADDEAAALGLLAACAVTAMSWGEEIAMDIPEPNAAAVRLAESLGMVPRFACTRMYRGEVRPLPLERVWGNTTFELG